MLDHAIFGQLAQTAAADGIQQIVMGAVIVDQGRILLLRRPVDDFMGGIWELPSGKVDPGEPIEHALIREVLEETGLTLMAVEAYLGSFDYTSGSGKTSRQLTFAVSVEATELVVLTEHDAHQWCALAGELPVTDEVRRIIGG
jgi:8-oxo-dGTP diphosphatase